MKLRAFRIELDNKILNSIKDVVELSGYLDKLREKHTQYINSLKPMQIIGKGAEIVSYLYKGLWDYYGEDWRSEREMVERIDKDGFRYWNLYGSLKEKGEENVDYYRKLYDIRNDFVG